MQANALEHLRGPMERALELGKANGASAMRITAHQGESQSIGFQAGRLKNADGSDGMGYSIHVVKDGRSGAASGNMPDMLENMVERALALTQFGAVSHFTEYPAPADSYASPKLYSPSVKNLSQEKQLADCQELVDFLKSKEDGLDIEAGAKVHESQSLLMTSGGFVGETHSGGWSISAGFQRTAGTDMLFSGAWRSGIQLNDLYDLDYLKQEMAFDLEYGSRTATIADGAYPVYIPPAWLGSFLRPISMGISGRSVFKGTSPLGDQLGKACFASNLTIVDDPHTDFRGESSGYDGAGIPTIRRNLVENGVLQHFLYDWDTAHMASQAPTGHDGCAPHTMLVKPGDTDSRAMLRSIDKGIYIRQLLGFGQGNLGNGDFSCNIALGYVIEKGEVVGRLKNAMAAGNILELLKGDIRFSSDVDPQTRQPYAILSGVNIVSRNA